MISLVKLPKYQYLILCFLERQKKIEPPSVQEIAEGLKVDQVFIAGAAEALEQQGYIKVQKEPITLFKLKKQGLRYAELGFPERRAINALENNSGSLEIKKLASAAKLSPDELGEAIKYLLYKNWAQKHKVILSITPQGKQALKCKDIDERLVDLLYKSSKPLSEIEILNSGFEKDDLSKVISQRPYLVKKRESLVRRLSLTLKGEEVLAQGISAKEEITKISTHLLLRHKWQEVEFKPYDITLDVAPQYPGKIYPFQKILSQTRQVFLEMGFEEVFSPHIESCFWNFDALFQPQDHPARDMQDTFYLKEPQSLKIPKSELVSKIQSIHENGGDTGSLGWGMPWSKELAKKAILRAHATATTIRALAENPQPPRKVFCIERVFRREAVDFKHLPVFYQVDGIVIDKEASLASLFGILTLFYKKMGFEKIELRPSFFPYTEPSVEIFVYFKQKKQFVEMGGAGIFRPEVTLPFGCNVPVLAWGLGLERLAMLRFGLDDMRKIYMPSLKWIKELPSCL